MTGGSLIVAIGAQNAYVLRQGLMRSHVATVVAVCAVSDVVLIAAGVAGVGAVLSHAGWVINAVTGSESPSCSGTRSARCAVRSIRPL